MGNLPSDHLPGIKYGSSMASEGGLCFPTAVCKFSENEISLKTICAHFFQTIFFNLPKFNIPMI